jgi:MoaA/NifB/PqqE/SkfB family radical SAM enzyme
MEPRTNQFLDPVSTDVEGAICDRCLPEERFCIIYTLRCNLSCSHCMVKSSPDQRETLSVEDVVNVLHQSAEQGKKHVTFSGGEIFLYYEDLLYFTKIATSLNLEVDVETNAFWASTVSKAENRLAPLKDVGLKGICLSIDAYHEAFFSIDYSINAYHAARNLDLLTEVNFCPSDNKEKDKRILEQLQSENVLYLYNRLLNKGRAEEGLVIFPEFSVEELPDCDSLNLTIHSSGDTFVCCELEDNNPNMRKTPVYTGNILNNPQVISQSKKSEKMLQAFYNPDSPAYFRKLIQNEKSFKDLKNQRFKSICEFCNTALMDFERVNIIQKLAESD